MAKAAGIDMRTTPSQVSSFMSYALASGLLSSSPFSSVAAGLGKTLRQEFEILEETLPDNAGGRAGRIAAFRSLLEHARPGRAQRWVVVVRTQGVFEGPKDRDNHRVLAGGDEIGDIELRGGGEDKPTAPAAHLDLGHRTPPFPESDDNPLFLRVGRAQAVGFGIAHTLGSERPPLLRPRPQLQRSRRDDAEAFCPPLHSALAP